MDDLVQFLRDRLDEDERIAKEAGERSPQWRLARPLDDAELGDAHWLNPIELKHVERHDPARALAEVDAKRRTLAELQAAEEAMDRASRDRDTTRYNAVRAEWMVLKRIVRRDASVYAGQPGYREEWRP